MHRLEIDIRKSCEKVMQITGPLFTDNTKQCHEGVSITVEEDEVPFLGLDVCMNYGFMFDRC